MDTAARPTPATRIALALMLTLLGAAACSGGDESGQVDAAEATEEISAPVTAPATPAGAVTASGEVSNEQALTRGPLEYPDTELADIAASLMNQSEVTNPDWERHIRERFTGPGLDPWIEGRREAIADLGLTIAMRAAAEAVRGEVIERGQDTGAGADVAKVSVWMKQPLLEGLARFDLRLVFVDGLWKIRVPALGLNPQGRTG